MDFKNDDFYGEQDDDDFQKSKHGTNSEPKLQAADALVHHENKAQENKLKTISYLEAFEEYKEKRLQEGFENGYRASFNEALDFGRGLGKRFMTAEICNDSKSGPAILNTINTFLQDQ